MGLKPSEIETIWLERLPNLSPTWQKRSLLAVAVFLLMPLIGSLFTPATVIICALLFVIFFGLFLVTARPLRDLQMREDRPLTASQVRFSTVVLVGYISLLQILIMVAVLATTIWIANTIPLVASQIFMLIVLGLSIALSAAVCVLLPSLATNPVGRFLFWYAVPRIMKKKPMKSSLVLLVGFASWLVILLFVGRSFEAERLAVLTLGLVLSLSYLPSGVMGLSQFYRLGWAAISDSRLGGQTSVE